METQWNRPRSLRNLCTQSIVESFLLRSRNYMERWHQSDPDPATARHKLPMFQKIVSDMQKWWPIVTCNSPTFENLFQISIDEGTEKYHNPDKEERPCEYIFHLLMKLLLLDEVFIDRDYSGGNTSLVPLRYEVLVLKLIRTSTVKFPMRKLVLYGPMFPHITEAILKNSPRLESLAISHNVITNEILYCVGEHCSLLKSFVIIHYNLRNALSKDAVVKTFFSNSSKSFLRNAYEEARTVPVSFPHLQTIDVMGLNFVEYNFELCSWILFHYKSLSSLTVDWRTNLFSNSFKENDLFGVLLKLIKRGRTFHLKDLIITTDVAIMDLSDINLSRLVKSLPFVQRLFVNLPYENLKTKDLLRGATNLQQLASDLKCLDYLYVKCFSRPQTLNLMLLPLLKSSGHRIQSLTIDWDNRRSRIPLTILEQISTECSYLKSLKIKFDTRCDIDYSLLEGGTLKLRLDGVKELWLHEMSPWDTSSVVDNTHPDSLNWLKLLDILLSFCPNLEILSVTTSSATMSMLNTLSSRVSILHLHIKDAFEVEIQIDVLVQLIKRFPNLQKLYLEELEAKDYWWLKSHFKAFSLDLFWGNLNGWPRT